MNLPPLLPRAPHGGPTATAFRGLDFSVNTNPYGPNPALLQALSAADHAHYPDPAYSAARQRLAHWHGVAPDQIALSVGASDLLHRLARAFLPAGGTLLSLYAPFGELARAAQLQRATIDVVSALPNSLPSSAALVYVGQPHNPTGRSLSADQLEYLADVCAAKGALLIVDLAYMPFTDFVFNHHPSAVALYSPGKAHGLVGARPAYAVASAEVTAQLDNLAPAWHLPAGTAAVLEALPAAQDFLTQTLPRVRADQVALAEALRALGTVEHHSTPYLTLDVGSAARVTAALLAQSLRVRDCTSYGFARRIRVSTQGAAADTQLIAALRQTLSAVH